MNSLKNLGQRALWIIIGIVAVAVGIIIVIVGWKAMERYDNSNDSKIMTFGFVIAVIGGGLIFFAFKKDATAEPKKDEKKPPPRP